MSEEFPVDSHGKIIVFGAKQIRRIWHDEQWFFSVVDIIDALIERTGPAADLTWHPPFTVAGIRTKNV